MNIPQTELALIGPILIGEPGCMAWEQIDDLEMLGVKPEVFSSKTCGMAWGLILSIRLSGTFTKEILVESFNATEWLGGTLAERIQWQAEAYKHGTAMSMKENAKAVLDAYARRLAAEMAGDMASKSGDMSLSPAEIVSEFETRLRQVNARGFDSVNAKANACDELDAEITAREKGERGRGLPTGNRLWDNAFSLLPSHFYLLASRPGCGKTALSESIIDGMLAQGHAVLNFQRELSPFRAVGRMAAKKADVVWSNFEKGRLNPAELMRLRMAVSLYRKYPLIQADVTQCTGPILHSLILRHARTDNIKLVVLDYIQLCDIPKGDGAERLAIADMSRHLRLAANETGVPIIAIAQLNREQEKGDRKPRLSDLKSCGSLEQDADAILALWNSEERGDSPRWNVNWSILKNRSGALGDTVASFDGPTMTFSPTTNREENQ